MIGTGGITRRRADAHIFFLDKLFVAEVFFRDITPKLLPHLFMKQFGKSLGKPSASA